MYILRFERWLGNAITHHESRNFSDFESAATEMRKQVTARTTGNSMEVWDVIRIEKDCAIFEVDGTTWKWLVYPAEKISASRQSTRY